MTTFCACGDTMKMVSYRTINIGYDCIKEITQRMDELLSGSRQYMGATF